MGVEVTVIDDSDIVGWAAAATRTDEIYMTSVTTMVDNVIAKLHSMTPYTRTCSPASPQAPRMSRLNILDHGNTTGFEVGSDWVTIGTITGYQAKLQELRPYFEEGGFVHLQHCEIGQNTTLLARLAAILNASVYAGTGKHNPVYRFNFGDYVKVDPDGTVHRNVSRP